MSVTQTCMACRLDVHGLSLRRTYVPLLILFLIGFLRVRETLQELQHAFPASPSERGREPFSTTDLACRGSSSSTLERQLQVVSISQHHRSLAISNSGRAATHDRIGLGSSTQLMWTYVAAVKWVAT